MTFPSPAQNKRDLGALSDIYSRAQFFFLRTILHMVPKLPGQNLRGEPSPLASVWGKCPHTARADLGPQLPLTGGVTALVGHELARVPLSCVIIARSVMSSSITALILSIGSFF